MTEDAPNSRSRSSWAVVVGLVLVFVVYPLSVGPAVWLINTVKSESLDNTFAYFYWPLLSVAGLSGDLSFAYMWYIGWWMG